MSDQESKKDRPVSRRGFLTGAGVGAVSATLGHRVVAQEFINVGSLDDWEASQGGGTTPEPIPEEPTDPGTTDPGPTFPETPSATIPTRRDIYTLDQTAIQSLRRGIAEMKRRSAVNPQDPRGWDFQARIHAGQADGRIAFCQHSNRNFLSWHRMYLVFFERILREASGDPSLTLPYWDYSVMGRNRLPDFMRFPANEQQNPLYFADRDFATNRGDPIALNIVNAGVAMGMPVFDVVRDPFSGQIRTNGFNRQLELQPHNGIHNAVGGAMRDPVRAGFDPIFWLHHCNIDRHWSRWLALGGPRQNPSDLEFISQQYNFVDEQGQLVSITGQDILSSQTQNYRYDDDVIPPPGLDPVFLMAAAPPPSPSPSFVEPRVSRTETRTLPNGDTVTSTIAALSAAPVRRETAQVLARTRGAIRLGGGRQRVRLAAATPRPVRVIQRQIVREPVGNVENVPMAFSMVAEQVPEPAPELFVTNVSAPDASPVLLKLGDIDFQVGATIYNIFVNLPDDSPTDPEGPFYAAYFAPFAQNTTDEPEIHDITALLNSQIEAGLWDGGEIDVQFVAVDGAGRILATVEDAVSIGQVEIIRS